MVIAGRFARRTILAAAGGGALAACGKALATASDAVHVADFGARGDGVTNDTDAINAAAKHIERNGGGTLIFDRRTYLIGRQAPGRDPNGWAFQPQPVIDIRRCRNKVTLLGNGATLRCAPGLRYGTFDRRTGRATRNAMPFTDQRQIATPYRAAIWLQENRGGLEVVGFELDGAIHKAIIGGPWGDTGWQINHCGIWLYNNRGAHLVKDVHTHHHGQDGLLLFTQIVRESEPAVPVRIENVRSEYNGRQGISLTGGKGVLIAGCQLSHTGQNGVVSSNPGAGLDLEAELSLIRDVIVRDCRFDNNAGQGMVADNGDTAGVSFEKCLFVGSVNYAAWPNKPRIRFVDCEFVGALTRCFEDPAGTEKATAFYRCLFTDDPTRGATRKVYGTRIDLGGSGGGTLFDGCTFRYRYGMQLPYTPETVRYRNCTLVQASPQEAYPSGIYSGINTIRGKVRLGNSKYLGRVTINGEVIS